MDAMDNGSSPGTPVRNMENSRLIGSGRNVKPNYLNLTSNVCAVITIVIIAICCFWDGPSLFSFHPLLMCLGWLLFMTSGVNSVTPGDLATEWMPIRLRSARHWVIQVCTGIIVLIAFIVIVANKYIHDKPHFQSTHAKFGLAAFIMMWCTKSGGLAALYSLQLKEYLAPIYIKLIHSIAGITTFSLGITAIILALFSNWWTFGLALRYIVMSLVLIIALFTVLRPTLKVFFRIKERVENLN